MTTYTCREDEYIPDDHGEIRVTNGKVTFFEANENENLDQTILDLTIKNILQYFSGRAPTFTCNLTLRDYFTLEWWLTFKNSREYKKIPFTYTTNQHFLSDMIESGTNNSEWVEKPIESNGTITIRHFHIPEDSDRGTKRKAEYIVDYKIDTDDFSYEGRLKIDKWEENFKIKNALEALTKEQLIEAFVRVIGTAPYRTEIENHLNKL